MNIDLKTVMLAGLGTTVAGLAAGKAVRRIMFLPIEWLIGKWQNRTAQIILKEAEQDVGINNTLEEASESSKGTK